MVFPSRWKMVTFEEVKLMAAAMEPVTATEPSFEPAPMPPWPPVGT